MKNDTIEGMMDVNVKIDVPFKFLALTLRILKQSAVSTAELVIRGEVDKNDMVTAVELIGCLSDVIMNLEDSIDKHPVLGPQIATMRALAESTSKEMH